MPKGIKVNIILELMGFILLHFFRFTLRRNIIYCRSLAACEQLYNAGYKNLFWVQGGLEAAEEEVKFNNFS